MHEFTVDGLHFRVRALKMRDALKAQTLLVEALIPVFITLSDLGRADIVRGLAGLGRLQELVDLFVASCQYEQAEGRWVDLRPFLDGVFERRNAALLAWLVECIEYQFADFLDGTGQRLLEDAVSRFAFLLAPTGESGGS